MCVAVGNAFDGNLYGPVVASWDGSTWSQVRLPTPPKKGYYGMASVSCPSVVECIAIGVNDVRGTSTPFAERWDGADWTALPPALAAGARSSNLYDIDCPAVDWCLAVGEAYRGRDYAPLVERWEAGTWTALPPIAMGRSRDATLQSVSCVEPRACVIVGFDERFRGLALTTDGSATSAMTMADLPATAFSGFGSVSCTAADACTAIGAYQTLDPPDNHPLVERWDGSTWTIQPLPAPDNDTSLRAVSCASSSVCVAVGEAGINGAPVIVRWDGSAWHGEQAPGPSGSADTYLRGLTCAPSGTCTAVGSWVSRKMGKQRRLWRAFAVRSET